MRYKIRGVSTDSANNTKFQVDDGATVSVAQYFRSKYNVNLQYGNLHWVQVTKRALYPVASTRVDFTLRTS
jgi:hypothetical protein